MTAFSAEELGKHANSLRALARDLIADEALAEDAVQDACVTALTRPPTASLAGWLRAVVSNRVGELRRSEQRRRRREQMAARSEASEDADTAGQLELQQDILAAVRSLDPAYRTAIWMRYYEHRTPSAIAAALGEPVKTVKTRLWRALQLLRHKLDQRYGDRRAWLGALVPLAKLPGRAWGLGAAAAAGVWLMQAKNVVAAGVVGLVLLTGAAWVFWGEGPPATPQPSLPGSEVKAAVVPPADPSRRTAAVEPDQPKAPPAASSPYGSLLVRVRWHDGTPAADVAIYGYVDGEPQLDRNELRIVADAAGLARAPRVHKGVVRLRSDRGGKAQVEAVGGVQREVDFVLPRGLDVGGVVLDQRGLVVASAQVVLVSQGDGWLGGRVLAVTDVAGAFAVRAVDPVWSLGARAAGYAPSALVDLEDIERPADAVSVQVQLRLRDPGADVTGMVVDETGTGIAEAVVVLGRGMGAHQEYEGSKVRRSRETWSPQVVSTGPDGSFRCVGVEPGLQPIVAWAEGCTRAQDSVQCVAGQTAKVTLALVRGLTVTGIVRNQAGEVVADAVVRSLAAAVSEEPIHYAMHDGRDKRPQTRSDAQGRYLLRGVPPGTLHLVAARPRGMFQYEAFCKATLAGDAGSEVTWNPVLVTGKTIRVRVVDAEGQPAWFTGQLQAHAEEPGVLASVIQSGLPEREPVGLYVFFGCADVPYTVAGRWDQPEPEARWLYRTGVRPGGPDVELRLPPLPTATEPGAVTGRIADLGRRLDGKSLSVSLCNSYSSRNPRVEGDRFAISDVPPGRYFIRARADGHAVLASRWFELQAGQQLDLGDLATDPGATVRVALRGPDGADLGKPAASLEQGFQWRSMRWDGTCLVADNVTIGRHRLSLSTAGWHAAPREFELAAGQDLLITLDVVPATSRRFDLELPLPDQWRRCEFTLRDAAGNVVSQCRDLTPGAVGVSPLRWLAEQPFGQFTLDAVIDGERRTWPVDLRDSATGSRPLRFSLR